MHPWSLMTQEQAIVLNVHDFSGESVTLTPGVAAVAAQASRHKVVIQTLDLFAQWLRQGVRYQNPSVYRQLRELVKALHHQGLIQSAAQLNSMVDEYLVKYQVLPCSALLPYVLLLFAMHEGE